VDSLDEDDKGGYESRSRGGGRAIEM
jgi:hypothetical protein